MKYYLLIAGKDYYPSRRIGDWKGCFETYRDAVDFYILNCSQISDWYEIVDLREWINR